MERPSLRKVSRKSEAKWDGRREVDGHRVFHGDEVSDPLARRGYYGMPPKEAVEAILAKSPLIEMKLKGYGSPPVWLLDYFGTDLTCKPMGRRAITELMVLQGHLSDENGLFIEFPGGTYRLTKDTDFHRLCAIVDEVLGHAFMYPTTTDTLPKEMCKQQCYYHLSTKDVAERLAAADPLIDVDTFSPEGVKYLSAEEKRRGAADLTHSLRRLDGIVSLYQVGRGKLQTRADYVLAYVIDPDPRWYVQLLNIADRVLGEYEFEP